MRRFILYTAAATIVVSLLATALTLTTHHISAPPCPICHAPDPEIGAKFETTTLYTCPSCRKAYYGPPRPDFSWAEAIEEWLDDAPVVE
jgi:transposase-like protein